MPASINDLLTLATSSGRPVPTTLTAIRGIGAASISCGALTGWPTATAVHFIIYTTDTSGNKVAGSQLDCKGIVSGTSITNIVYEAGNDTGNSIGAIVECAPTAAWNTDVVSWGTASHNQDGTHKSGATYLLPTIASFANANHDHTNSAGGGAIGTGAVSAAALATSAITLGYAQITSTFVGPANGTPTQVTGLTVTVTIPAGGRRIKITVFSNGLSCSGANQYATAHIWDGTVGSGTQLSDWQIVSPAGGYTYGMTMLAVVSPAAGSKTYNVGVTGSATPSTTTLTASAVYPAFILVEAI